MSDAIYESHSKILQTQPYIFHKNSKGCAPHWHENVEILYFHNAKTIYLDKDSYDVCSGDLVVISSDMVHYIPYTPEHTYDCVIADSGFCKKNDIDINEINFEKVITDKYAIQLFKKTVEEIENGGPFGNAAARASLLTLLVYLCRDFSHGIADSTKNKAIKQAIGYINSKPEQHITVDEVAAFVNMSKYHFCREFKKETGYTMIGYINLIRCMNAQKLLANEGCTVYEAARKCGFDNISYFTKTFKTITGLLPTAYKK